MEQIPLLDQASAALDQGIALAKDWLLSPAAWSQFALLIGAYFLAVIVNRIVTPRISRVLTPAEDSQSLLARIRRFVLIFLPLILPLLAYGFTAIGELVVRSLFDSGAVIAFGKRVFLFLAARALAKNIVTEPFLRILAKFVLVPVAALYAVGFLDPVMLTLTETRVGIGNIGFSVMSLLRAIVIGSFLFWLGQWSNTHSTNFIEKQSTLAVLGGAVGVGLGFGLQKIASNFISGVILLLEGQATVGDYVELDGGEAGTIIKMTARATILETYDGKWIVVPNEDFITTRVVNYSDSGSANRLEAAFSVSYNTDINKVPDLIQKAVAAHPAVLTTPEPPDCELRGFGESGIDFAVEFWVEGIDDGKNKYTSDILFVVWNALKDAGIEIPFPQRVIEIKGQLPK